MGGVSREYAPGICCRASVQPLGSDPIEMREHGQAHPKRFLILCADMRATIREGDGCALYAEQDTPNYLIVRVDRYTQHIEAIVEEVKRDGSCARGPG